MTNQAQMDILIQVRDELSGLRRSQDEFRKLREETTSISGMFKMGGVFGLAMTGAAGIARGAMNAVVGAVREAFTANDRLAGEISRNAGAIGLSAESYQVFATVLREADQDVGSLSTSLPILTRTLGDALNGNATALEAFTRVKLNIRELRDLAPDLLLEKVAKALGTIENPAQRSAAAQDLLGRSSANLKPLLDALSNSGLPNLKKQVEETNGLLSNGLAKGLDDVGDRSAAAGSRIAKAFAPAQLALREMSAQFKEFLADLVEKKMEVNVDPLEATLQRLRSLESRYEGPGIGYADRLEEIRKVIAQVETQRALQRVAGQNLNSTNRSLMPGYSLEKDPAYLEWKQKQALIAANEVLAAQEARRNQGQSPDARDAELLSRINARAQQIADEVDQKFTARESDAASTSRARADLELSREQLKIRQQLEAVENDHTATTSEKFARSLPLIAKENALIDKRVKALAEELDKTTKLSEQLELQGKIDELNARKREVYAPATRVNRTNTEFRDVRKGTGSEYLSAGEGLQAGAMDFVSDLGSAGEQVASALESSIGSVVSSISEGIYGWITGTQSFSDVLMNLGDTVFRTMINTIVQMGVQWLVTQALILLGMGTIERTGDLYRTQRVVKENAAEAATLPMKTAGATAAGISSYGVAIAFGVAAIAMIAALSGGFKRGGYTGDGDPNAVAGPAHKGEYYFTAADVKRIGIPRIEALRFGRADVSGFASQPAFSPAAQGEGAGGGGGGRAITIVAAYDQEAQRREMWGRESETHFVDMMRRTRHMFET